MGSGLRRRGLLAALTVTLAGLALYPPPYHRWWWWDLLMHTLVAGVLATWARVLDPPDGWTWPAFVAGVLAWEWVELSTPLLLSATRVDLLSDLTVNVVVFGAVRGALRRGRPAGVALRERLALPWLQG